jgi:hypothetical protein
MTLLCVVLIVLSLLVGYLLGRTAPQPDSSGQLEAIQSALEELTRKLCGDKDLEKAIEMTNEAGATLSDEELAYDGGSLKRIEQVIRESAFPIRQPLDILNSINTALLNIERALRQKEDSTRS